MSRTTALIAILLLASSGLPLRADEPPNLQTLVDRLGSRRFAAREAAMSRLRKVGMRAADVLMRNRAHATLESELGEPIGDEPPSEPTRRTALDLPPGKSRTCEIVLGVPASAGKYTLVCGMENPENDKGFLAERIVSATRRIEVRAKKK